MENDQRNLPNNTIYVYVPGRGWTVTSASKPVSIEHILLLTMSVNKHLQDIRIHLRSKREYPRINNKSRTSFPIVAR
jgi:hypothetical protein